jgi:cell division protein FtsA
MRGSYKPAIRRRPDTFAIVDIGSTKVACFIAEGLDDGKVKVIGMGHQLSKGIKGGKIVDISEAETSIIAAVHAAEEMVGEPIDNVFVSIPCNGVRSRTLTVDMEISGGKVSGRDLQDLMEEGAAEIEDEEYTIIHSIPVEYRIDGQKDIVDPLDMHGKHISADLHFIAVSNMLIHNLTDCLAKCHLNINDFIVAAHASGYACLEEDEMNLGVIHIEMGGGVTSFCIFTGGKNVYSDTVPVGGMHVTSDVAKGLSTNISNAERLKILHGSAIASAQDDQVMIEVPQLGEKEDQSEPHAMPRSMLVGIIRPRLEELLEIIRSKIEMSGFEHLAGRRGVVTGGASQLIGARELATKILGKQVRLGKPKTLDGLADSMSGPAFSVPIGLIEYVHKHLIEEKNVHTFSLLDAITDKAKQWFESIKQNF